MLTTTQLQTLKAAIAAETNAAFIPLRTGNDEQGMANWYNDPSTAIIWKKLLTLDEIVQDDGFNWTRVDNLTTGSKWRIWEWMFNNPSRSINPSKPNVRAGIDATWVGTAQDLAVRAAIYVLCKRAATRFEALFATGTKTDASPGLLVFEGRITAQDISDARSL